MLKFFAIFVITGVSISYADPDGPATHPSLPVLGYKSSENSSEKILAITAYECPAGTEQDIRNLSIAAQNEIKPWPRLVYCLFKSENPDSDKMKCQMPIKSLFLPRLKDENPIQCGFSENHHLYSFALYRCGTVEDLRAFRREDVRKDPTKYFKEKTVKKSEVYDVCYDTSTNETIWTSHKILFPNVFEKLEIKNRQVVQYGIRIDPSTLENVDFTNRKKIYELEAKKVWSPYIMLRHALVPPKHFAFDVWKETAYHIINQAPLYFFHDALMSAINDGLKEAQMKYYRMRSDSSPYTELKFYTRVVNLESTTDAGSSNEQQLLKPNIWHKFIYNEAEKTGLMIHLHNILGEPPQVKHCDTPIPCNFDKWTNDTKIDDKKLQYAYCCPPNPAKIEEIFSSNLKVKIKGPLNLNSLFVGGPEGTGGAGEEGKGKEPIRIDLNVEYVD